jgi:methylated-DNA-protein-cysteine methyltransferase related protein
VDDANSLRSARAAASHVSIDAARELIIAAVAAIPSGAIASYGAIATRAGLPGRARMVAKVLSQLPAGSGVPWHRVLRASACIAFPSGSQDFERQRRLLVAEGCAVTDKGRVEAAMRSPESLDEALWGGLFPD